MKLLLVRLTSHRERLGHAIVLALLLSASTLSTTSTTFAQQAESVPVEALQHGGYVIYFRHAMTDSTQKEAAPVPDLANCSIQRNLTSAGREQARIVGEVFRARNIPVSRVLSSEFCRALDTGRLAFGSAEVSPTLLAAVGITDTERQLRADGLKKLLATSPPAGTNVVLVSHKENIQDATACSSLRRARWRSFTQTGRAGSHLWPGFLRPSGRR